MSGASLLKAGAARQPHFDSDGLRGLDNIADYAQYGRKLIPELVEAHQFPAVKFYDTWESSKTLIDEWRLKRLRSELCQQVSDSFSRP